MESDASVSSPTSERRRARVARLRPRLRVCEWAASEPTIMYAGDRRRMIGGSSNHRCQPSGADAGSRHHTFSSEEGWRCDGPETGHLRVPRTGTVDFLRVDYRRSASPFGGWMGRGRGASFGLHRSQMRPISIVPFGEWVGRDRKRSSLRAASEPEPAGTHLRVGTNIGCSEPNKAETLCLPHRLSGPGAPKRVGTARRNVQRRLGGAR